MSRRRKSAWQKIQDLQEPEAAYPAHLRGFSHQHLGKPKGFKGSTYGAASKGRRLSVEERRAVENKLREEGKL